MRGSGSGGRGHGQLCSAFTAVTAALAAAVNGVLVLATFYLFFLALQFNGELQGTLRYPLRGRPDTTTATAAAAPTNSPSPGNGSSASYGFPASVILVGGAAAAAALFEMPIVQALLPQLLLLPAFLLFSLLFLFQLPSLLVLLLLVLLRLRTLLQLLCYQSVPRIGVR